VLHWAPGKTRGADRLRIELGGNPAQADFGLQGAKLFDDVEDLADALAALAVGHAIRLISLRHPAAADSQD